MFKKSIGMLLAVWLCALQVQAKDLVPGGESIGIQIGYDGVVVSGTYTFEVNGNKIDPSSTIQPNDLLISINGVRIYTLQDLSKELNRYQQETNEIPIELIRNQQKQTTTMTTSYIPSQNTFKSGLYVKDKITGVGTISFYDPETKRYGALGHEITDTASNLPSLAHDGVIYSATVDAIQKAKENVPGEKQATIDFTQVLGSVDKNTFLGIYGNYEQLPRGKSALPIAERQEIHTGKALIYTVLHGKQLATYEVEITKLHTQKEEESKGIELTITDTTLLQETNGIIQGMSGSPIIQDGKIIGALTHVITSDPIRGYGVYIDWMLQESR